MTGDRAKSLLAGSRFADVRWVESIESTNAALLAVARDGAPEGRVVVADHQTSGRGRLGRVWEAPAGSSLLVSVLLRPATGLAEPLPVSSAHLLTVAVAAAAAAACDEVAGVQPLLKWPNDLMVDDRKLGGVLAESVVDDGVLAAVVVGLGVNVNWPPAASLPPEVAALGDSAVALGWLAGREVDRESLLVALLTGLDYRYSVLGTESGRRELAMEYRSLLATLGRRVRVELPGETVEGEAVDVTLEGHLVVAADSGVERVVTAGDVVHLRPAG
ncbi:MAG: biotin--[acetyl-CoA-carboxylase] ligase [Acidimicrobiales bacterium]|nr:biotin--[acetyl-CoA-carboxylase] ligase [Acidimicrobiales bacterium]